MKFQLMDLARYIDGFYNPRRRNSAFSSAPFSSRCAMLTKPLSNKIWPAFLTVTYITRLTGAIAEQKSDFRNTASITVLTSLITVGTLIKITAKNVSLVQ